MSDKIYKKYQDLFDFTSDTIEKSLEDATGQDLDTLEKPVTLYHYVRASYLLMAVNKLCLEGLSIEAMVLLRSLLNLFINIKWLSTGESKERFQRFADFDVIFRKLAIDKIIQSGGIEDEIKNDDPTLHDEDFKKVKEKYDLKTWKDFYNWSGKSIYEMAKDADLVEDYKIIYGRLSSTEHTGPDSVRDYLDDKEEGKTLIKQRPTDEKLHMVLLTSLVYYFKVKVIWHNIFDLDWPDSKIIEKQFVNLQKKYWGQTV